MRVGSEQRMVVIMNIWISLTVEQGENQCFEPSVPAFGEVARIISVSWA
ncbi:hypothetical protein MtrunA17_Chr3g0096091 [Medicago truncatula]|uniref:Uncharacterized protein n=1 Tax=Medicago truncatula TaxID=3880 RepID=A0A396IMQ2_MEDTR|nr:hypothetical protein MtrunA17_Chr3g0096091 [Medicago truncatula]